MKRLPIISALMLASIAACTSAPPAEPTGATTVTGGRPLDVLPGDAGLGLVRDDLMATAADRFGQAALDEALASPTYLIAKRFAGMVPPPPPGSGPDWVAPTPTALLIRDSRGWMVASESGWRPLKAEFAAEIDSVIADPAFWNEAPTNLPCPDYGASLLLLKAPEHAETVRKSSCTSISEKIVLAALNG